MPRRRPAQQPCQLCERQVALTFHHLIPRKLHRRPRFYKRFNRNELNTGVWLCSPCHSGIHQLYDELTLGQQFSSLEALRGDEAIARHVRWVAKQRAGS
ncbi:MAG: hypothetical protein ACPHBL_10930 [Spongiibacter marinus]|uniref:hypothetical protein n=1 Tax=Spongiibacter marinus TaxID=354246 RepID=UPI003C4B132E